MDSDHPAQPHRWFLAYISDTAVIILFSLNRARGECIRALNVISDSDTRALHNLEVFILYIRKLWENL